MSEASIPASAWPELAISGRPTPWRGLLLLLITALTPVMAYASQEGFVPAVALAGLLMGWPTLFRRRTPNLGMIVLLLLTFWELYSLNWSVGAPRNPNFSKFSQLQAFTALKLLFELALFGTFVVGATAVSAPAARRAGLVLAVLLSIMAVVVAIEAFQQAAWFQWLSRTFDKPMRPDWAARNVARATYFVAVLFWPVAHLLSSRPRLMPLTLVLLAGGVVASLRSNVDAPVAALLTGAVAYAAVRLWGRPAVWLLIVAVLAYLALTPLAMEGVRTGPLADIAAHSKASWGERLRVWSFTDGLVLKNPLFGWGIQASRAFQPAMPMHPHDAALQLWLELGVPGVALVAAFWVWVLSCVGALCRSDRAMAAAAAACTAAYLTIGALSFDVWDVWWLALGAFAFAICGTVAKVRAADAARTGPAEELVPI